jgi:ketosteroid isomerase-like protein
MRRALVFGDSQTEALGEVVAGHLRQAGFTTDVVVHKGYTSEKLLSAAQSELTSKAGRALPQDYEVVFLFAGGNDARKNRDFGSSVLGLVSLFRPGAVWWTGPGPQTRMANAAYGKAAWKLPKSAGPDYWLGERAAEREAYNLILGPQVAAAGGNYLDLRQAGLGGRNQGGGVTFPDLADGVHVTGATAVEAGSWVYHQYASPLWGALRRYAWVAPVLGGGALWLAWRRKQ